MQESTTERSNVTSESGEDKGSRSRRIRWVANAESRPRGDRHRNIRVALRPVPDSGECQPAGGHRGPSIPVAAIAVAPAPLHYASAVYDVTGCKECSPRRPHFVLCRRGRHPRSLTAWATFWGCRGSIYLPFTRTRCPLGWGYKTEPRLIFLIFANFR